MTSRVYLDNAATSWPKPEAVYAVVDRYQRESGAPAGRGTYREATQVERDLQEVRRQIARLLGVTEPRRVLFTGNGTDSLNLAIHGLIRSGDHVITTVVEHNSVLRPLRQLEQNHGVEISRVSCDGDGIVAADDFRRELRPNTRLFVLSHVSNVTGAIQPVAEVAHLARNHGLTFLLDAAQSLGHLPVSVEELHIDLLAAPGHKGLLGPLGTGILYLGEGLEQQLIPVRQGGTGTRSESDIQPDTLPERYESGNLNVPGLVGLGAGVSHLLGNGINEIHQHEQQLTRLLLDGLRDVRGVTIHGPNDSHRQTGVVSMTVSGYDPQEVAALLDATHAVQVRGGLHCAPRMHAALGTMRGGGTVRFSVGPFTSGEQIATAVRAVEEMVSTKIA